MSKSLVFSVGCFVLGAVLLVVFWPNNHTSPPVSTQLPEGTPQAADDRYNRPLQVGSEVIQVEIADTPEKMQQGLSGRKELLEGQGMLFVYSDPQVVTFWMPDMYIPLDMLFIRGGTVVHLEVDVPNPPLDTPKDQLELYSSREPIDWVLEVPAGWSAEHGVDIGSSLKRLN